LDKLLSFVVVLIVLRLLSLFFAELLPPVRQRF
jgi:hypothetical protein